jgi:hypothetical protein
MKISALIALCASLFLALSVSSASALNVQEKLIYDVSWTGVSAAIAVQEVSAKGDEIHIVSTTRSVSWLNTFFSVNDRVESVLTRGNGEQLPTAKSYWEKINEGRFHAHKEARFDMQNLKVETKDFLKKTQKTDPISSKTFDSLSCIYYVRGLDLVPGKSVYVDIYDCKRLWITEVKVLRREEITTPVGRFKTIVVKPILKAEGFFARSGDITVWLTDDSLRIPVMMTTKVKIGKITATVVGGSYWPQAKAEQ